MTVQLMLTCLADTMRGDVGIAAVRLLEAVGVTVQFPPSQTCCGQPAFNAGDRGQATPIAHRCTELFESGGAPVVTPSASCAAMTTHGYEELGLPPLRAQELGTWLYENAWAELGSVSWKSFGPASVAFHPACHMRSLGPSRWPEILTLMPDVTIRPLADAEQCCGFGGSFSHRMPVLAGSIASEKGRAFAESGAAVLLTTDLGCALHLQASGLTSVRHVAEFVAERLP